MSHFSCPDLKRDGQSQVQSLLVPFTASVIGACVSRSKVKIINLHRVVMSQTQGVIYKVHEVYFSLSFFFCLGKWVVKATFKNIKLLLASFKD